MYFIVGTRDDQNIIKGNNYGCNQEMPYQLNGLLGNNSVVTDVRICNRKVQRQGQCCFLLKVQLQCYVRFKHTQIDSIIHIYFTYLYMYMYITYIFIYINIFNYTYNYTYLCMTIYILSASFPL